MEVCAEANKALDTEAGAALYEMVESLLSPVDPEKLWRLSVSYKFKKINLDTFLGRAAHVRFLDNLELTATLILQFRRFFD